MTGSGYFARHPTALAGVDSDLAFAALETDLAHTGLDRAGLPDPTDANRAHTALHVYLSPTGVHIYFSFTGGDFEIVEPGSDLDRTKASCRGEPANRCRNPQSDVDSTDLPNKLAQSKVVEKWNAAAVPVSLRW